MLAFSNIFNSLNMLWCVAGSYSLLLHCDVTSKALSSVFNRLLFRVNMLGGHCMQWATVLILMETDSEHSYSKVYKSAHSTVKHIMAPPACGCQDCRHAPTSKSSMTTRLWLLWWAANVMQISEWCAGCQKHWLICHKEKGEGMSWAGPGHKKQVHRERLLSKSLQRSREGLQICWCNHTLCHDEGLRPRCLK